jgi:hypothetical protein
MSRKVLFILCTRHSLYTDEGRTEAAAIRTRESIRKNIYRLLEKQCSGKYTMKHEVRLDII